MAKVELLCHDLLDSNGYIDVDMIAKLTVNHAEKLQKK